MTFYLDLHVHSPFSSGASPNISLFGLAKVARIKGISIVGTGDCLHPQMIEEINDLEEDDELLYFPEVEEARFIPSVEINCKWNKGKQSHILLVMRRNDIEVVRGKLKLYGNLDNNGRPDIALEPRELTETIKTISPNILVIPAHALTPWFGFLGSRNNLTIPEIVGQIEGMDAIETGLSADRAMYQQLEILDNYPLVSFSDAHSVSKLGREVTMITLNVKEELTYDDVIFALRASPETLEHIPQLGKYYYDGCRACGYSQYPKAKDTKCPQCGKNYTLGTLNRTKRLSHGAKREVEVKDHYIIPLYEILDKFYGKDSKDIYQYLTSHNTELEITSGNVWLDTEDKTLNDVFSLIHYINRGKLIVTPGYDGIFGKWEDPLTEIKKANGDKFKALYEQYFKEEVNYVKEKSI